MPLSTPPRSPHVRRQWLRLKPAKLGNKGCTLHRFFGFFSKKTERKLQDTVLTLLHFGEWRRKMRSRASLVTYRSNCHRYQRLGKWLDDAGPVRFDFDDAVTKFATNLSLNYQKRHFGKFWHFFGSKALFKKLPSNQKIIPDCREWHFHDQACSTAFRTITLVRQRLSFQFGKSLSNVANVNNERCLMQSSRRYKVISVANVLVNEASDTIFCYFKWNKLKHWKI